ncbi:hypothetical protein JANAI62_35030 [Jannaschia pagri]|uniref:DUF4173 domain-containing protein n=1 Tax=Jannaschia pagri TaxID=2829797 RepID=A0ABQ4NR67_9RHOB|nr:MULTISPECIES: DUF4173 domain-containing protein [unclassified Jannaschia]GIT93045.1 hypothetical protein JANAI61_35030 [Jannaschia sp. AI_61]GIT96880.1 hypothetical protein JANAI62_35030 [Jannaschia sp. AI_62]
MHATPDGHQCPTRPPLPEHATRAGLALVVLLPVADWLLFDHSFGVAAVPLALGIFAAALWCRPRPLRQVLGPALLLAVGCLPVVIHPQVLSLALLGAALLFTLAWVHGRPETWLRPLLMMLILAPQDAVTASARLRRPMTGWTASAWFGTWTLPIGGALVLVSLLADANPVLRDWVILATRVEVDSATLAWRALFWIGVATMIWPLLRGVPLADRKQQPAAHPTAGINAASVARALVVFNGVMALQTVTDLAYLWGGAALPEGMTYASYAHRGAYPLLATALLAIAFSLVARPFTDSARTLRWLLAVWIVQNLGLTASSVLRLWIYVEAYGLTYLRFHAAVWMALVACGLLLALWQVARRRSTRWLLARGAALAVATLYGVSLINMAAFIASHSLARDGPLDLAYLCGLPPTAHAVIAADSPGLCPTPGPEIVGWRDWGFHKAAVRAKLDRMESALP